MPDRRHRRVLVAGSGSFPLDQAIGTEVVDILREYPEGTVFLTRARGRFDTFVSVAAETLGYVVVRFPSPGGSRNWDRDVAMAHEADEAVAFFDPATLHDMNTGTGHLVEKLLDQRKRVRAFTEAGGHLVFAGEMP